MKIVPKIKRNSQKTSKLGKIHAERSINKSIKTNAIMTMETRMLEYSQQVYVVVEVVVFIVVVVVLFIVVVVVALWSKMEKNTDKIAI